MTSKALIISMMLIIAFAGSTSLCAEQPLMQVRVYADDAGAARVRHASGFDVVWAQDDYVELITDAHGFGQLRSEGFRVEVVHEDVEEFYASRLLPDVSAPPIPFGGYKTLTEIYDYLDDMITSHPGIITNRISIGQTIEGRDIYAVKISDNPDIDEDEPELFFHSLIHSHEVITPEVLLYFMDYLTDNYGTDPEVTYIVDNRELWFVLIVNPDGYVYNELTKPNGGGLWSKNRRDNLDGSFGVDLDCNFDYEWGYDIIGSSPSTEDEDYRGVGPFSEPESQAIRDFCVAHDFVITVAYHSYWNWILFPWGYDVNTTPDEGLFWVLADSMSSYNGYTPKPSTAYVYNGGFNDWSYGEQTIKNKSLSLRIEVGDYENGFWPELESVDTLVAENLGMNLFLCRVAEDVYPLTPPGRPEVHVPEGIQTADYTVSWIHNDAVSPAVEYELVELRYPNIFTDYGNTLDYWRCLGGGVTGWLYYSEPNSFVLLAQNAYLATKDPVYIAAGDILECQLRYNLDDDSSYLYVEVSPDDTNYTSIPGNLTTNYNPYGFNAGNGITGSSSSASEDWVSAQFDVSSYEGQSLFIRFYLKPVYDDYVSDMLYIDDVRILKSFSEETVVASGLTDTLYNFTDRANGEYFYQVRAHDAEGQWSGLSSHGVVTVESTAGCCDIMGDYNGDGRLDILDLDDFTGWLLKQLPDAVVADCTEEVDVSSSIVGVPDGTVSILDLDYLIGYMLRGDHPTLPECP